MLCSDRAAGGPEKPATLSSELHRQDPWRGPWRQGPSSPESAGEKTDASLLPTLPWGHACKCPGHLCPQGAEKQGCLGRNSAGWVPTCPLCPGRLTADAKQAVSCMKALSVHWEAVSLWCPLCSPSPHRAWGAGRPPQLHLPGMGHWSPEATQQSKPCSQWLEATSGPAGEKRSPTETKLSLTTRFSEPSSAKRGVLRPEKAPFPGCPATSPNRLVLWGVSKAGLREERTLGSWRCKGSRGSGSWPLRTP